MTIKKLIVYATALLVLATGTLTFFLITMGGSLRAIDAAQTQREHSLALANELRESSRGLTAAIRSFAVTGNESFATAYMDIVQIVAGEKARPSDSEVAPGKRVSRKSLMQEAGFTERELGLLQKAADFSSALIVLETEAMNAVRGHFPDGKGGYSVTREPDKARATSLVFSPDYDREVEKIMAPISQFMRELDSRLDGAVDAAKKDGDRSMLLVRISVIVLVLVFAAFLLAVALWIVRPILDCDVFAKRVATGNLDSQLPYQSGNEIGSLAESLRFMLQSLRERIGLAEKATTRAEEQSSLAAKAVEEANQAKLEAEKAKSLGMRQAGEQLFDIAEHIKGAAGDLRLQVSRAEEGAATQQGRLAESFQAVEQLNQAVLDVARSTASTTDSADKTRRNASEGAQIVEKVVASIGAVDSKTMALRESLDHLGREAEGIGKIMAVISDIADQTNLLALNAAIEAARAGDAGRGFAVVADEVRKLAEKTMQATGEVGSAVRAIQAGTTENIRGMQDTSEAVKASTDLARAAGDSLRLIVDIAKGTAEQVHSIAAATEEQSATCEQISVTTESINRVAGETYGLMEKADQAVGSLAKAVDQLMHLTDSLRKA